VPGVLYLLKSRFVEDECSRNARAEPSGMMQSDVMIYLLASVPLFNLKPFVPANGLQTCWLRKDCFDACSM
jgi:hypothetical protein